MENNLTIAEQLMNLRPGESMKIQSGTCFVKAKMPKMIYLVIEDSDYVNFQIKIGAFASEGLAMDYVNVFLGKYNSDEIEEENVDRNTNCLYRATYNHFTGNSIRIEVIELIE